MKKIISISIICIFCLCGCENKNNSKKESAINTLSPWSEGCLDIHHINTGAGDATFFIFPDGTTMLFDAGNLDKEKFEKKYSPLKATSVQPNSNHTAAYWISKYIKGCMPEISKIDYAIVSHFHEDHYGSLIELFKEIPIQKVIDRNYPNYDFPVNLRTFLKDDILFQNYLSLVESGKVNVEALIAGEQNQIALIHQKESYSNFNIRNIKSNASIWTGNASDTFECFSAEDMLTYYKGKYNENPLSLALKISYGKFDYFTGGDNTGLKGYGLPNWFDVETPMAKVIGKVEALTLNHHGNRDATNMDFVNQLNPKVVVQQTWCSDHPGQEVYQRLNYKDEQTEDRAIFSTNMHPETLVTYGPWFKDSYKNTQGHVVIRVSPKGESYHVFVLDSDSEVLSLKNSYGPYSTH